METTRKLKGTSSADVEISESAPIEFVSILLAPKNKYRMGSKGTPRQGKTSSVNPKDSLNFREKNMGETKQTPPIII